MVSGSKHVRAGSAYFLKIQIEKARIKYKTQSLYININMEISGTIQEARIYTSNPSPAILDK